MSYAITDNGWRAIGEGWELAENETCAEEIPQWLLDTADRQRAEMTARSDLNARISDVNNVIQPLQDDYDIQKITDTDLAKLRVLKKYRSALGKTPEREGWPGTPDWPESTL
ncbi:tail fiber assembly protein [Pseudomonas sp. URIL14HWK12:I6]|jgi:hypothetical protein|uniref:tail fiber assembly protein n=1 Tax=Pseudomonas sp. URIL14HWK12:I6 TaxID=1283293 RepID=UPI000488C0A3|nr:tail fiber assembly protein [Pseudomonas sp. URIL14HWK12:I6]